MADYRQRAQAYADATLNRVATQAEVNRLGQAIAFHVGAQAEYAAMTADQKAAFIVKRIRGYLVGLVRQHDQYTAAEAAKTQAGSAVDAEFAETP